METAISASYFIPCRRNKSLTDPELLNYVLSDKYLVYTSYFNRHVLIIKLLKMFQPICKFQIVKLLSWKKTTFKKNIDYYYYDDDYYYYHHYYYY